MNKISLLYAKNIISRKAAQQELSFLLQVENIAFGKSVTIVWTGEDGVWHELPAAYHGSIDNAREYWFAHRTFPLSADQSLPGNVQFALRYRVAGVEYWDNHQGENFSIQADSGVLLAPDRPLLRVECARRLADQQLLLPVVVAVNSGLKAGRVSIEWTTDDWKTSRQTVARYRRNYWDSEFASNARNPNHYGCKIWDALLKVGDAFRVQYRIACEIGRQVRYDDNSGQNHVVARRPLSVMILNLHCCQEEDQDDKLSQIARAIDELGVDIVCLQEVAELWNEGHGDWQTNTARIINERLASPYHLVSDWSHRGFERYREGVAILSRHPLRKHAARYVSATTDPYDIHARKVVMAQVEVPCVGPVNVFSSHLSWWEDGFGEQFQNLRQWAAREHGRQVRATLLGGDFNIKAGGDGYRLVVASNEYTDQFLSVRAPELCRRIFEGGDALALRDLDDDQRIDYVFLRRGSALRAVSARLVFTDQDYGPVSDHPGYLMTFVPK